MSAPNKETMSRLRQERHAQIKAAQARIKEQTRLLKLIKAHLAAGPDTVPGIAAATGLPTREVLWYLTALRKYGQAVELEKKSGYFRYALTPSEAPEESAGQPA